MSNVSEKSFLSPEIGVAAASLVALALVPFTGNEYWMYLVGLALIYSLSSMGLNLLMGFGPIISLGHAGFFAVGAYTTGIAMTDHGLPLIVGLLFSAAIGAVVGIVVALPALRLAGLYLVIASLAFGLVIERVISGLPGLTGGHDGLIVVTSLSSSELYWAIFAVVAVLTILYRNVALGGLGVQLKVVRDHPIAAESMGINIARVKVTAFSLSAAYAAIGGGLYACLVSFIVGPSFALELSLLFVLMVMLGGAGSVYGPIIGAAFVVAIPEVAGNVDWGLDVVYGLTIVVIVLLAPRGLAGLTEQMTRAVRARTG